MRLSIMPSMRQCAGSSGPAAAPPRPPRAPAARPAGIASARVISRVTPGLLNFVMSVHLEFVWAKAVSCIATARTGTKTEMLESFIDFSLLFRFRHEVEDAVDDCGFR